MDSEALDLYELAFGDDSPRWIERAERQAEERGNAVNQARLLGATSISFSLNARTIVRGSFTDEGVRAIRSLFGPEVLIEPSRPMT